MRASPRECTVLMHIRYDDSLHRCLGTLEGDPEPRTVRVSADQLPVGFAAEYNASDIVLTDVETHLVPAYQPSHSWFCEVELDLDEAAALAAQP